MKVKPYSSAVLALCGLALIGVGAYFIFLRPALLPEDARYIGASLPQLELLLLSEAREQGRCPLHWRVASATPDNRPKPLAVAQPCVLGNGWIYPDDWRLDSLCGAHLFLEASTWCVSSGCSGGLNLDWLDDHREFYHSV